MSATTDGDSQQSTKCTWKLQEFVCHSSAVNCLSLGHKSGRVLVTGGEDKKVNLWAVGSPNCIMSLSGHNTAISSVTFDRTEELVCAGGQGGTAKIWDLQTAKIARTLTGHKSAIRCIDFHPYGDLLSTGSIDSCVKLWDTRKKGSIFSYKGHKGQVNSVKFSPDGSWIASGGDCVKLWDMRTGKQFNELVHHTEPVTVVDFHPHEFLLASGSSEDQSVALWDLETFSLIGAEEMETVRCVFFHPDGDSLLTCTPDTLRVCEWEPQLHTEERVNISWGRLGDISTTTNNQLVGASYNNSRVTLWVVDLRRLHTDSETNRVTRRSTQTVRRSFSEKSNVCLTEKDKCSTVVDDSSSVVSENVFNPRQRNLNRTPTFKSPKENVMTQSATSKDPLNVYRTRCQSSLAVTRSVPHLPLPSQYIEPQFMSGHQERCSSSLTRSGYRIVGSEHHQEHSPYLRPHTTNITHSPTRDPHHIRDNTVSNVTKISYITEEPHNTQPSSTKEHHPSIPSIPNIVLPSSSKLGAPLDRPTVVRHIQSESPNVEIDREDENIKLVPNMPEKPTGLQPEDFLADKFGKLSTFGLSRSQSTNFGLSLSEQSESEVTSSILRGHCNMMTVLTTRCKNVDITRQLWHSKDVKTAVEKAVNFNDPSVIVDLLSVIVLRPSVWNLDLCLILIPPIGELLLSKYESYINSSANALKLILKNFATVIKSNIDQPNSTVGVDISKEERTNKCIDCYRELVKIRSGILQRQKMRGKPGHSYKELAILMQYLD